MYRDRTGRWSYRVDALALGHKTEPRLRILAVPLRDGCRTLPLPLHLPGLGKRAHHRLSTRCREIALAHSIDGQGKLIAGSGPLHRPPKNRFPDDAFSP